MSRRLENKVAIVTGAGTGIGEAIAHKYAQLGARIVAVGLPTDPVDDVVTALREMGVDAVAFKGDISSADVARACVEFSVMTFGKLDILVNNAGLFLAVAETQDYPIDKFQETTLTNVQATFLMTKFALPHLQKTHGVVLATGSEAGMMGEAQNTIYGASKGWVHAFIRGVAAEQAKHGVRANCVCPGPIDTAWTHASTSPMDKKMEKATVEGTLLGRRGTPEEVANVFAFLASDEASFVTAALWTVDGGTTAAKGPMGSQVPHALRVEPVGELSLSHSHDGLKNKHTENLV